MPNVVVRVAIIRSHIEQVRGKSGVIPVAAGLVQGMRPGIAQKIRQPMPWALGQGDLQSVIVAEILIRDVIDVGQIREFLEVRSPQVFTRSAARSSRRNDLSWRVGRITRRSGQPTGTGKRSVDVIQSD